MSSHTDFREMDNTWVYTSTIFVLTMQTGFAMLEGGHAHYTSEVNILIKNCLDVVFGGLAFWMVGFGLAFGDSELSNSFCGWGFFFFDPDFSDITSKVVQSYVFQLAFSTTATTIVSGCMIERTKLGAYAIFAFLNNLIYAIPAHWVWADKGWLYEWGFFDTGGDGPVHLVGGLTGLMGSLFLGQRIRFKNNNYKKEETGNPTNSIIGVLMLWWGWFGFNGGSSYTFSSGNWPLVSRASIATINGSVGGGVAAVLMSVVLKQGKFNVGFLINGILGGLVSITSICAIAHPWEALLIGMIGAFLVIASDYLLEKLHVDDPVGVVPVHAVGAAWGIIATGIFADKNMAQSVKGVKSGLIRGGGMELLGIQCVGLIAIGSWTAVTSGLVFSVSFIIGWLAYWNETNQLGEGQNIVLLKMTVGLRVTRAEELAGMDLSECGVDPFKRVQYFLQYNIEHDLVNDAAGGANKKKTSETINKNQVDTTEERG